MFWTKRPQASQPDAAPETPVWAPLQEPFAPPPPRRRPRAVLAYRHQPGLRGLPRGIEAETITIVGCPNLALIAGGVRAGRLVVQNCTSLRGIDAGCRFEHIRIEDCPAFEALPDGLRAETVHISGCPSLRALPANLDVKELVAVASCLETVPADIAARRLNLFKSRQLKRIPDGIRVSELLLSGCTALRRLPRVLKAAVIDLTGCTRFEGWKDDVCIEIGLLLNLSGCARLRSLPAGLAAKVIELADSGVVEPSAATERAELRWRGVRVGHRHLFDPTRQTAAAILAEPNAELRRILIERVGLARFLADAKPRVVDRDRDAGGQRLLLEVVLEQDEPLRVLSVACPSTGKHYLLRVPPWTRNGRHAAAWLAGFDDPDDYRPVVET